jgi:nucleotide-binding universal stress UspA family protein
MYKHLLIATDGSALSDRAVTKGVDLAKQLGAKVTFVTVSEMWSPSEMADRAKLGDGFGVDSFEAAQAESARKILAAAAAVANKGGVASDGVHVADKRPAEGVCAVAASSGCDLLVIATHGRRGMLQLWLGSQAMEIIAMSPAPVFVVR